MRTHITTSLVALTLAASIQAQTPTKAFDTPCPAVWSSAIQVMVDNDFTPKVMDKDSGVGTFAHIGEITIGRNAVAQDQFVKPQFGSAVDGQPLRLDSTSVILVAQGGKCMVSINIAYSLLLKEIGWYSMKTNFAFETRLLDKISESIPKQVVAGRLLAKSD
jgi:hypothetical protein